ncbi:MAG: hypothetical protein KDI32_13265 [Pseudomonadales bacterium]|nr:hypothetical protein [Pseudomonadales bacterium]
MAMPHKSFRGKIHYTSDKPGREGQERGREYFTVTAHADGRHTLQSHCEIDDAPAVMRDVTLSFDSNWLPADCFVRIDVGNRFVGSSWFRFTDREFECEGYTVNEGRISQRVALSAPARVFGTHPIAADGLLCKIAALDQGPKMQLFPDLYLCSLDHRGATGPMIMRHPIGLRLGFVGREKLTVGAGTFDALHFRIGESDKIEEGETRNEPGKHPAYEMWTTADGHYIMLKAWVSGYMMTSYELVSLEIS